MKSETFHHSGGWPMGLPIHSWESPLLTLAQQARQSMPPAQAHQLWDDLLLERSYAYCDDLTARFSRSFYLASALLPIGKRKAVRALYAFCRTTDDIVDRPVEDAPARLQAWRARVLSWEPPNNDPVAVAWAHARATFTIPEIFAEQLIDGVAQDLHQKRYKTFEELASYAYGVASTVGLMSMHITGFSGPTAVAYAIKMGVALQLTNILRDVGEDWRAGRLYLPQEELTQFGLSEADIAEGRVDDRWREFMRFNIERNRQLYAEAWPGIGKLHPDGRLAITAAADLYRAILREIEANDYDVFTRRAYVGTIGKLRRLPAIWWRSIFHG